MEKMKFYIKNKSPINYSIHDNFCFVFDRLKNWREVFVSCFYYVDVHFKTINSILFDFLSQNKT